jgi:hypothetical protein
MSITWEHFHRDKIGLRSNKSETYLRIWADFFRNFGLIPKSTAAGGFRFAVPCVLHFLLLHLDHCDPLAFPFL